MVFPHTSLIDALLQVFNQSLDLKRTLLDHLVFNRICFVDHYFLGESAITNVLEEAIPSTEYHVLLSQARETCEAIKNIQDVFGGIGHLDFNRALTRTKDGLAEVERSLLDFINGPRIAAPANIRKVVTDLHDADFNNLVTLAEDMLAQAKRSLLGSANGAQIAAPANIGKVVTDLRDADFNNLVTLAEDRLAQAKRSLLGSANGAQIAAPANVRKEIADTDRKRTHHGITPFEKKVAKTKRGLPGFINGTRTAALADTGAAQNIISLDFAHRHGLVLEGKTARFRLGNSKSVKSAGTVKLRWAFAEKPTELYEIICHVIQHCTFDVILGSKFLTVTETLSKHLHRLVNCVFNVFNVSHLTLMDGGRQTVDGQVGDWSVHAIADTGAERNVMDSIYAEALGFKISKRFDNRGFLQFADGTFQETVGQVDTTWTFASGLEIPITFEILENCSADVILGEDFLLDHDVFGSHAASMQEMLYEDDEVEPADLSHFGYTSNLQQKFENGKTKIMSKFNRRTIREAISRDETLQQHDTEERHRRDQWIHQYGFEGLNASPAEKEAEARRRENYNARTEAFRRRPPRPGRDAPLTASTPTAPETTMSRQSPVIPSIPTAPNTTLVPPVPASATNTRGSPPTNCTSTAATYPDSAPNDTVTADLVRRGLRYG